MQEEERCKIGSIDAVIDVLCSEFAKAKRSIKKIDQKRLNLLL